MRPFFSQNAQLAEIIFDEGSLDVGAIDVLTEAVKERGEDVKTIRSFDYESVTRCQQVTSWQLICWAYSAAFGLSSCQAIASLLAGKNCMLRDFFF